MATTRRRAGDTGGRRPGEAAFAVVLGPAEVLPGRPFTDPRETEGDVLVMTRMLALEREIALTGVPTSSGRTSASRCAARPGRCSPCPTAAPCWPHVT